MAQDRSIKHSTIYEEGSPSVIARRRGCTLRLKIGLAAAEARHRSLVGSSACTSLSINMYANR